ncbi:MAG: DUF2007 domain-containing protein [Ignavibacteriales bacterium]|nr:MAG: DUF2007 domain-containing protein [Ignavibacteriales bacterium]
MGIIAGVITCPVCQSELSLSEEERTSGRIHCGECESLLDYSVDPPKIYERQNYDLLLTSLNQGDISIIKSILDDGDIDYYLTGENFLMVSPLLVPVSIYVNRNDFETARELLKDFDLHIFGASDNQY